MEHYRQKPSSWLQSRVVSVLVMVLTAQGWAAHARGTEFSPSIVMTNTDEMGSKCIGMVDRAAGLGARNIKFVPTVHYFGSEEKINSFCYRNAWGGCDAASKEVAQRWSSLLATCMKHAADKGLNIGVLAHLDNAAGYTWRNLLQFSPTAKYGGYTYLETVLRPIATALARSINKNTEVVFTLQGETGKSVSQYSKQWLDLVKVVKRIVNDGGRSTPKKILVGISMNYNKVYGWLDFDTITPADISADFDRVFKQQASQYPMDLPNFKRLYEQVDVIGVSAYPPLQPNFQSGDLEVTLRYHAQELSYAGIDLKKLIDSGKRVVISEWGVGGGTQDGNSIAANVQDVAGLPFFGLWYPYSDSRNPWKNQQYNQYRYKLYRQTAKWLKNRGGPTYRVDGLYMWNAGSWDAGGVHYATPAPYVGGWADTGVIDVVRAHNKAVR